MYLSYARLEIAADVADQLAAAAKHAQAAGGTAAAINAIEDEIFWQDAARKLRAIVLTTATKPFRQVAESPPPASS